MPNTWLDEDEEEEAAAWQQRCGGCGTGVQVKANPTLPMFLYEPPWESWGDTPSPGSNYVDEATLEGLADFLRAIGSEWEDVDSAEAERYRLIEAMYDDEPGSYADEPSQGLYRGQGHYKMTVEADPNNPGYFREV